MDTLEYQKKRLEAEVSASKASIQKIQESHFPDLKALTQLNEAIVRNQQLIEMIEQHLKPVGQQRCAD